MTLVEKLKQINKTPVIPLQNGFAEKAEDFWNDFIFPRLPKREIALQWHKVLTEYVTRPNAIFVFTRRIILKWHWTTSFRLSMK